MAYYAFTVPGVEGLLAREIADGGGRVSERRSGVVFFEWQGDQAALLHLGLAEDVFAPVARQRFLSKKTDCARLKRWCRVRPTGSARLMHYTARALAAVSACVSAWLSSAAAAVSTTCAKLLSSAYTRPLRSASPRGGQCEKRPL